MADEKQYMTLEAVAACEKFLRSGNRVELMTTRDGLRIMSISRKTIYEENERRRKEAEAIATLLGCRDA